MHTSLRWTIAADSRVSGESQSRGLNPLTATYFIPVAFDWHETQKRSGSERSL